MQKELKVNIMSCTPNGKTFGAENKPLFDVICDAGKGPFTATAFSAWELGEKDVIIEEKEYNGVKQFNLKKVRKGGSGYQDNPARSKMIAKQCSLKEAVNFHTGKQASTDDVTRVADIFFAWIMAEDKPKATEAASPDQSAPPSPPATPEFNDDLPF